MNDKPEERELSLNEIRRIMDPNPEGEIKLSRDELGFLDPTTGLYVNEETGEPL